MAKPVPLPPPGFDDLSIDEKIDYLQSLWDRIAPRAPGDPLGRFAHQPVNDDERAAMTAYARVTAKRVDKRIDNLTRSVPSARVVHLPGAGHYLFLTREAEVLSETHRFVMTLK
jgi:pimeloyl-ACP methyl ester carboxylesterase